MRAVWGALCAILPLTAAQSESMRCGKWVVDETVSVQELLAKCGEPTSKEIATEDVIVRNPLTGGTYRVGTKTTERWVYRASPRRLPMMVTIVDGKIARIERMR